MGTFIESLFSAPQEPDSPFGTPALILLDSIRVLILGLGVLILAVIPVAIHRFKTTMGQAARIFGLGLFVIVAITTEYDHIGDYAHFRLFLNIFATIGAAWGMWSLLKFESPAKLKGSHEEA